MHSRRWDKSEFLRHKMLLSQFSNFIIHYYYYLNKKLDALLCALGNVDRKHTKGLYSCPPAFCRPVNRAHTCCRTTLRDQYALNLLGYFIQGNLISGGPLDSNTLSIQTATFQQLHNIQTIWIIYTNTRIHLQRYASHGICGGVWSEEDQGLTGPRCPGLGLQALESWSVAPLHEVQLFFRHASGPVKISLMGRDRHLRALHPQDLWISDSDTMPKSLT